jgi:hypothetical protein
MRNCLALAFILMLLVGSAFGNEAPARFDKQWAADPSEFLSSAGDRQWVIGRSTTPSLSGAEATQRACRDAARQMASLIYPVSRGGEREWASEQLYADLTRGDMVRDRSVTRIQKPYGELWSAMVLVDASPARMRAVAAGYGQLHDARRRTTARQWMSFAGLFASILVVYAVLNALTKGYFRGRLRAMAVLSLIGLTCGMIGLMAAAGAQGYP